MTARSLRLKEAGSDREIVRLSAVLPATQHPLRIRYRTSTGALLKIDGIAAGAFDREHHDAVIAAGAERELSVEVERESLPTNGLPSGPGVVWRFLKARSRQRPARSIEVEPSAEPGERSAGQGDLAVIGHSHLDVAWLWTYAQTRRKAQRTFAIACDLLDHDPQFLFTQSQPQLYAFVEETDPQLFERVLAYARTGRFDPQTAAMWVESDCNLPSGESLLRQMLAAHRYCRQRFGIEPSIAWLPDTFGFANTLPQLLAHAGIRYFATTKLQWNDTTRFAHPQFVWEGPDGSAVVAALLQSYDGGPLPWRVRTARQRDEPLICGYGDGGGGVTRAMLEQVRRIGRWIAPLSWFEALQNRADGLPRYRGELYLEYHRGVYTTHHDVKVHNALLERALEEAEELVSWCIAVHAPASTAGALAGQLRDAWTVVLRNQFHDVLPGTSIAAVYRDAENEYVQAEQTVASVIASAKAILPRPARSAVSREACAPVRQDDAYVFDNGILQARVRESGAIVELQVHGGRNVLAQGNLLALYRDRPKAWEAWNVDAGYDKRMRRARPRGARVEDGALLVDMLLGRSPATMRVALAPGEAFLCVDLFVDWRERRTLLRLENWIALESQSVTYGAPHGSCERSASSQTAQERAQFEVPGQRFAFARDAAGDALALLALDTYGWSARTLREGGLRLGHSLLRGTCWPDEQADLGEQHLRYAFAPLRGASVAGIEYLWKRFAHEPRVALFETPQENVIVAACKPSEEDGGVVVRVRECNGEPASVQLRCAARMTTASAVDALERAIDRPVRIEGESLLFDLKPFELRSFRVVFRHET